MLLGMSLGMCMFNIGISFGFAILSHIESSHGRRSSALSVSFACGVITVCFLSFVVIDIGNAKRIGWRGIYI